MGSKEEGRIADSTAMVSTLYAARDNHMTVTRSSFDHHMITNDIM